MQQEVILAMLAKEPSHGYELRARLRQALGPLGDAMNDGHVYVTLTRLEKAGLVASEPSAGLPDRPDRKVYALTAAGQQRVKLVTRIEGQPDNRDRLNVGERPAQNLLTARLTLVEDQDANGTGRSRVLGLQLEGTAAALNQYDLAARAGKVVRFASAR